MTPDTFLSEIVGPNMLVVGLHTAVGRAARHGAAEEDLSD